MYDTLRRQLYAFVRSKTLDGDLIDEVIAETFCWFFESGRHKEFNSKDWDNQKENIRRLLFSKAKYSFLQAVTGHNKGWTWYKEVMAEDLKPKSDEDFDEDFLAMIATVEGNQDSSALCDQMLFYINELQDKERDVILKLAKGGTPISIAQDWKWKVPSVLRTIDSARANILELIERDIGEQI
jgi:DNA-directed RNA polymerase specialized sigma24 family protein